MSFPSPTHTRRLYSIMSPCSRHLLVKGAFIDDDTTTGLGLPGSSSSLSVSSTNSSSTKRNRRFKKDTSIPLVQMDPAHPCTLSNHTIGVPKPGHQLEQIVMEMRQEFFEEDPDEEDRKVFGFVEGSQGHGQSQGGGKGKEVIVLSDNEDDDDGYGAGGDSDVEMFDFTAASAPAKSSSASKGKTASSSKPKGRPANDWKHDPDWVSNNIPYMLPAPADASPGAAAAVQRELKAMLKEQESCNSYKELGWYMPLDFIGDNLFQWIVEMHSFDPDIEIAKDLKQKWVSTLHFYYLRL
jgi:ubiquitin-conjugating enzyme E2 Q